MGSSSWSVSKYFRVLVLFNLVCQLVLKLTAESFIFDFEVYFFTVFWISLRLTLEFAAPTHQGTSGCEAGVQASLQGREGWRCAAPRASSTHRPAGAACALGLWFFTLTVSWVFVFIFCFLSISVESISWRLIRVSDLQVSPCTFLGPSRREEWEGGCPGERWEPVILPPWALNQLSFDIMENGLEISNRTLSLGRYSSLTCAFWECVIRKGTKWLLGGYWFSKTVFSALRGLPY